MNMTKFRLEYKMLGCGEDVSNLDNIPRIFTYLLISKITFCLY
jgi:hypothetical protein